MKIFLTLIIAIILLTACGTDPVKDDLTNYINDSKSQISGAESEILNNYGSVTGGNYKDDATTYKVISEKVVPPYRDLISKIEAISPKTKEVQDLNAAYVAASNKQYNAIVQIMAAIEQQDTNLISQANEKLTEARKEMKDFNSKTQELADKHGVTITKKN